jgi:ketosteroid isomerase-like protein
MSENVDLFLRGIEGLNRGEIVAEILDPDFELVPLRAPITGSYRGLEGMRAFVADTADNFELFQISYDEVHDLGDRMVAIGSLRVRGKGSGVEVTTPSAVLVTFRDGKLLRSEDFGDRDKAMAAAGLSPP